MAVTILAIVFLIVLVIIAIGGSRLLSKQTSNPADLNKEKCSICRKKFDKGELVLREIGDYKLLYFCRDCIVKLYADLGMKN
ncbi:MAG: hypothetical protein HY033_01560 [Ignavibacteriae bacterium]|nr:hypothetical protein [Ignavibacteria bacterium]MBI3363573.1 hypothetical protein [Ignavibacteriota bacterium]